MREHLVQLSEAEQIFESLIAKANIKHYDAVLQTTV